jgi:hypothetical protein
MQSVILFLELLDRLLRRLYCTSSLSPELSEQLGNHPQLLFDSLRVQQVSLTSSNRHGLIWLTFMNHI